MTGRIIPRMPRPKKKNPKARKSQRKYLFSISSLFINSFYSRKYKVASGKWKVESSKNFLLSTFHFQLLKII